jgi:hypothetical protein
MSSCHFFHTSFLLFFYFSSYHYGLWI